MKDRPCPRTVFRQTQKIKNVCLKRRFQFVGRMYKLKTPTLLPGKSPPIFTLRFAPVRPCFTYGRTKTGQSSTSLQKGEHFPLRSPHFIPYCREGLKQKGEVELLFTCSNIFTKLANGLKRWQSLKDPAHAKDYAIKPHQLFIAFPFALIQPLWLVPVQSLKQFRYLA